MELAFGARLPGPTHLQLQKFNPATTRTTEQPARTPNKRGYHYHGAPPVLPRANLYALASPTRTCSLQVPRPPTPGNVYHTKLMGTHSDLLLSHGPRSGATRRLGPDYLQHGPGQGPACPDSLRFPQDRITVSRPLGSGDPSGPVYQSRHSSSSLEALPT